mmetsp:Transcript_34410/g.110514  ORF Transcript_34410/g.110514 Transcript_34410/m.110514 type:complete len:312 (+) Transcript_34410:103-1038(+)
MGLLIVHTLLSTVPEALVVVAALHGGKVAVDADAVLIGRLEHKAARAGFLSQRRVLRRQRREASAAAACGRAVLWHRAEDGLTRRLLEKGVAKEDRRVRAAPARVVVRRAARAVPRVAQAPTECGERALPLDRHRVDEMRRDEHAGRRAGRRLGGGRRAGGSLLLVLRAPRGEGRAQQRERAAYVREAAAPKQPVGREGDPFGPRDGGADACRVWWRCDVLDEVRRLGSLFVLLLAHGAQHAGASTLVRARRVKGVVLVAGDDEPLVARLTAVGERDGEGGDGVAHQLLVDEGVRVRLASEVGWLVGGPVE